MLERFGAKSFFKLPRALEKRAMRALILFAIVVSNTSADPGCEIASTTEVSCDDASSVLQLRSAQRPSPASRKTKQSCEDVLHVMAGGHTCGDRIDYLTRHGWHQRDAKAKVAGEFPYECGACGGTCGSVWDTEADGHTCGNRITWLQEVKGMDYADAKQVVASEYPGQCGACGTLSCDDVRDRKAGKYTCGERVDWLMSAKGYQRMAAGSEVATEFPEQCGVCQLTQDSEFLRILVLPKECENRPPQTSFPFHWGSISASDIVLDSDPTSYQYDLTHDGSGPEFNFWDYRDASYGYNTYTEENPALRFWCTFKYDSGNTYKVKVRANPNDWKNDILFKSDVTPYLKSMGRIPEVLFSNIKTLSVNGPGLGSRWGAAYWWGDMYINLDPGGYAPKYWGETFIHEAVHLSLQPALDADLWRKAIDLDCDEFYTSYAKANWEREGIAESFLMYWALRYRSDRLTSKQIEDIVTVGPNRMKFFYEYVPDTGALLTANYTGDPMSAAVPID